MKPGKEGQREGSTWVNGSCRKQICFQQTTRKEIGIEETREGRSKNMQKMKSAGMRIRFTGTAETRGGAN
jgi:hypothetical protein